MGLVYILSPFFIYKIIKPRGCRKTPYVNNCNKIVKKTKVFEKIADNINT